MAIEPIIIPFRHRPLWNFSYVLACPETREAAVIDPAWDVASILRAADSAGLDIRTILLTHSHSDHANGVAELVEATGARVFLHSDEQAGLAALYQGPTETFASAERWKLGRLDVQLLPTPGHTTGSMSIWAAGHLFSGDTLQIGSVGRPAQDPGAIEALWESLRVEVLCLDDATVIHPGHDEGPSPTSTLGEERLRNRALSAVTLEEFKAGVERASGWSFGS